MTQLLKILTWLHQRQQLVASCCLLLKKYLESIPSVDLLSDSIVDEFMGQEFMAVCELALRKMVDWHLANPQVALVSHVTCSCFENLLLVVFTKDVQNQNGLWLEIGWGCRLHYRAHRNRDPH